VIEIGGQRLSMVSALAQFETAEDIAQSELRIEMIFPADEETPAFLLGSGDEGSGSPQR